MAQAPLQDGSIASADRRTPGRLEQWPEFSIARKTVEFEDHGMPLPSLPGPPGPFEQGVEPDLVEELQPAHGDSVKRHRVEVVQRRTALAADQHEVGLRHDAQMLRHRLSRDRQPFAQLRQRLPVADAQAIEQNPAVRVAEGREDTLALDFAGAHDLYAQTLAAAPRGSEREATIAVLFAHFAVATQYAGEVEGILAKATGLAATTRATYRALVNYLVASDALGRTPAELEAAVKSVKSANRTAVLLRVQRRGQPATYVPIRLR